MLLKSGKFLLALRLRKKGKANTVTLKKKTVFLFMTAEINGV